ncbi:uncharacterized protein RB166_019641 [Leptodactylus fuscus]|uniref:uncharacterized protein LOC142184197 n=1 Tax=Leptodactylus fuscus TaxID=238119 RepID=UPI003F4EC546
MAVSSLQYTMGISSGFKVYILEGQHSARNMDRYRPLTNHGIPIYPIKRKLSPDPPQPQKRFCSSSHQNRDKSSPVNVKCAARQPTAAVPTSPKVLAAHVNLKNVLRRLIPEQRLLEKEDTPHTEEEQPLALIKRLEKPSEQPMVTSAMLQQMRPSVITCISRPKACSPPATENKTTARSLQESQTQRSPRTCSPEVEEHFQRSLKSCTTQPSARSPPSHSSYSSVEDHFSKALGSRWLLIRAAADSPSSQENPTRH